MEGKEFICEMYSILQMQEMNSPLWPEEEAILARGNKLISIIFKEELGLGLTEDEIATISMTTVDDYDAMKEYIAYDINVKHAEELLNDILANNTDSVVEEKKEDLFTSIMYRLSTIDSLTASKDTISGAIPQKKISRQRMDSFIK